MRQHYNRLNEKNQRQCGFKINSIWLGEFLKFIRLNRSSIALGRKEILNVEVFEEIELSKQ